MTNSLRNGGLIVAAALIGGATAYAVDQTHSTTTVVRTGHATDAVSAPPARDSP